MKTILSNCEGFQWDEGNFDKNWDLHQVDNSECEELFFNLPLVVGYDSNHSTNEQRYYALGRTDRDRWLFIAFTVRDNLIRVISARDMNDGEINVYAKRVKKHTKLQG